MSFPAHDSARLTRARLALDGLSVGDAFGECFFGPRDEVLPRIARRELPRSPWHYTDDTEMAIALVEVLAEHGHADPSAVARGFVRRFIADPNRGYGAGAVQILQNMRRGESWENASRAPFGGQGSRGNGGAMRVAPLGAYFADDIDSVVRETLASAQVTHAHPDGQAGAVAVAVAAACAWRHRDASEVAGTLLDTAWNHCPCGPTRDGLFEARNLPFSVSVADAVAALGNGSRLMSSDTVPFAIWCAERHLRDYAEALWTTVWGGGDCDTTCAIVGGLVALCSSPPDTWLHAREDLRFESPHRMQPSDVLRRAADRVQTWAWSARSHKQRKP